MPPTQFEQQARYLRARTLLEQWLPDSEERHTVLASTPTELFRYE